jgi:site-specific recombinase XerD
MPGRRGDLPDDLGALGAYIDGFVTDLRIHGRSARTQEMYVDVVRWFAGWLVRRGDVRRWEQVDRRHLLEFFAHLSDLGYKQSYKNNVGRCLQAFFKWLSAEEQLPNPYDRVKPPEAPKLGTGRAQVLTPEQMNALISDAEKGRDFESRRDAALLRLFACTGCRLSEITNLKVADIDIRMRTAVVTGKGGKTRKVRFDLKCALSLDRYLRRRGEHPSAGLPDLWFGVRRRRPMTPSGVRQVLERRGERLGMDIWPHLMRHTFSHNWLDAGGAEGDLMELNGWESPQMLRHYGASAKAARARRAYDRVDVMGGI